MPSEKAESWLGFLHGLDRDAAVYHLAAMQLARRTNDRYCDLSDQSRDNTVTRLRRQRARRHLVELVENGGQLDSEEQRQVFGESLPKGLRMQTLG